MGNDFDILKALDEGSAQTAYCLSKKQTSAGTVNGLLCKHEGYRMESTVAKKQEKAKQSPHKILSLDQYNVKNLQEIRRACKYLIKAHQNLDLSPDENKAHKKLLTRAKRVPSAHFESLHDPHRQEREKCESEAMAWHRAYYRVYYDNYYWDTFNLMDEVSFIDYLAAQWSALAEFHKSLSNHVPKFAQRLQPLSSNNLEINPTTFAVITLHHAIARQRFAYQDLQDLEKSPYSCQVYRFACVDETPLYCERAPNTFYFIKRQDKDAWGVIHYDDHLRATSMDSDAIVDLTQALNAIRPEWMEWIGNRVMSCFRIEREDKIRASIGQHFDANIPQILLEAPEVFGKDLLSDQRKGLHGYLRYLGKIEILGEITPTGFYIERYCAHSNNNVLGAGNSMLGAGITTGLCRWLSREPHAGLYRETIAGPYPIADFQYDSEQPNYKKTQPIGTCLTGNGKHVFDLVEWALASDIVDEHQQAIKTLAKTSDGLRYLVSKPHVVGHHRIQETSLQQEDDVAHDGAVSPWAFNSRVCEPLFARFELLDHILNDKKDGRYQSVTRRYLQQLDHTLISPLYKAIKRHRASKKLTDITRVKQLDALLEQIGTVIHAVLKQGVVDLRDSTMLEEIKTLAVLDQCYVMEERLKARTWDETLLELLHQNLCVLLRKYVLQKDNKPIYCLVESLKESFFKALRDDFAEVVSAGFTAARNEFIAAIKPLNDGVVKDNAVATLTAIDALACRAKKKKGSPTTVCHLTEALREATYALEKAQQYGQAPGERLMKYADQAYGKPGLGWKILGGVLITLGVLIAVAGILIAHATLIPTCGLGTLAGYALAASGSASLLTLGVGFFCHGRRQSLSKQLKKLGEPVINKERHANCCDFRCV